MPDDSEVPSYEPMLAAYHRAFREELRAILKLLPIGEDWFVLDMACGDGAYTGLLAERVGERRRVVGVDRVARYLEFARSQVRSVGQESKVELLVASIDALPFPDHTFDLCWCAQSLYSLPDPVDALKQLTRVVQAGGVVAVFESDTLHRIILPWPVDVEIAVRNAELRALVKGKEPHRKFYVGRELRRVFRQAGLRSFEQRTLTIDRMAPLQGDERIYFAEYLDRLARQVRDGLDSSIRGRFERLVSPSSGEYLLDDPDLTVTCVERLAWGRKPA